MSEEIKKDGTKNKSNKILIGIIAALSIVIIVLAIIIIGGGKDKDNKKDNKDSVQTVSDATESDVEKTDEQETSSNTTEDNQTGSEDKEEKTDCFVTLNNSNSWEGSGKFFGQVDAKITNNSGVELKNWKIEIPVSDDVAIDSFWNGNCELKDGVITITPVEYNGTITAGGNVSDIGIIVSASSKDNISAMLDSAVLYIDGKVYTSSEHQSQENTTEAQDTTEDAKEDDKTEESTTEFVESESGTPFDNHGKLSVKGTDIVDENGKMYQLKGVSTHGIAWFPDYVNKEAFKTFRDDWDANLIRIAMYVAEYGGYCNGGDKEYLKGLVDTGVKAATELGMYVIIDWHVLQDLNPQAHKEDAKAFFEEMSSKYKDYDNVIYEICNEPNGGTSWSDVKAYAEEIIPIIRKNAPDAIIIVGTPNWSQDVDVASKDPITGYDNIMYAIHFYASTHKDNIRSKAQTALDNGLPIFVSEFSICDASGDGAIDYAETDKWFEFIGSNNLSYAGWNISNKNETSSLIKSSCTKTSGWTEDELSETGIWLRKQIKGIN